MKLTPLDIQQHQFEKKKGKFYDAAEVDSFLETARVDYEEVLRIVESQKEQIRNLEAQLAEMHANERVLKDAIVSTQKITEEIKINAQKEADIMLAEARLDAERLVDNARKEIDRLQDDITELKRQRIKAETEIRAVLHAHDQLLEATSDRMKEKDTESSKVRVFAKKA
ncbi:MAG: DivIVA domain-containing protein [Deltaproteobacteria bacterium]|nr:DivIVA domain-containing protein [Deltaproteobacteria bacterium]